MVRLKTRFPMGFHIKTNYMKASFPATLLLLAAFGCSNQEWPQFRGPYSNMLVEGKALPSEWAEDQNVRWTYSMEGESWSSPITWGEKVFVTSCLPLKVKDPGEPVPPSEPPTQEEEQPWLQEVYRWQVACVNLATGEELWKQVCFEGSPRTGKHQLTNYAGETPVTDGERVYVYFGMIGLFTYDLEGNLLWQKDLGAYETLNNWGTGSSPLVYNHKLYLQVDSEGQSFLVALDPSNGNELWRVNREEGTTYCTPVIWNNTSMAELVTGGKTARSYDPETGQEIWSLHMGSVYPIPSAVPAGDILYLGNAGARDVKSVFFAVKTGGIGDITPPEGETTGDWVIWSDSASPLGNPTPVVYEGLVYIVGSRGGELTCLDAATGEVVYREKMDDVAACWASPWIQGDKLFFYDEKGITRVIRTGRKFQLLHENKLDDRFWASIAVAGDAYLIKGVEKLYCIGK